MAVQLSADQPSRIQYLIQCLEVHLMARAGDGVTVHILLTGMPDL